MRLRATLRPPRRLTVSQWAEENRLLGPRESAEPGRWRNDRAPYLVGPMDAMSDPLIEVVVFCSCAQAGKTEALLNFLGYTIDHEPGPTLIVYPSERTADKTIRNRLQPMISSSPALRRHTTGDDDSIGMKELHFDSCSVYSAWANSPAALSSTPCRNVILDEIDKFPAFSGVEASPIKLAHVRTRTYRGRRKMALFSTPTLEYGAIWQEYQQSDRRRYFVPCPHCGTYQTLEFFDGVVWEKDVAPAEIATRGLAWYVCKECKKKILERSKPAMLRAGVWCPDGCAVDLDGVVTGKSRVSRAAGFHLSVLYSPWATWGEVAAEFLESKDDRGKLMGFWNSWLALPWKEKIESLDVRTLHAKRKTYDEGVVPDGVMVLTAGVDVQEDHMYFVIRGWGDRERSWMIRHGTASSWADVWRAISAQYKTVSGQVFSVQRAFIDSGYKTDEVYRFCRTYRPVTWPAKGSGSAGLNATLRPSRPEGGTLLYTFKADYWKDKLSRLIHLEPGEAGDWSLPRSIDEPYLRQMTAERRVLVRKKGRIQSHWEPITEHAPNHYFDCEVLNVIAAEILGVRYFDSEIEKRVRPPPAPTPDRDEGWLAGGEALLGPGDRLW